MKQRIISVLLRIYPAAWRQEYGPEFREVLTSCKLRVRTVANVVWNGARQRLRTTEPWVLLGLPVMIFMISLITMAIVAPAPYSPSQDPLREPALYLVINLIWISLNIGCGLWTVLRDGGTLSHAGLQTIKMGLMRGVPVLILAILLTTGALGVIVIGPGDTPTTFAEHGFAITFGSAQGIPPDTGILFVTPFAGMVECWVLGAIGGMFGRLIRTKLRPAH